MLKKIFIILGMLLICVFLLAGCGEADEPAAFQSISARDAYTMMNEMTDFVILDVRTEQEFREIRIDGAILIPYSEIRGLVEDQLTDKSAVILVYCQSGRRSAIAAQTLANMGYRNVYDFGGIVNWAFETVSGDS